MSDTMIKTIYYNKHELSVNIICNTNLIMSLVQLCKRLNGRLEQKYMIDETYDNAIISFSNPHFAKKFIALCQELNSKGVIFFHYSNDVLIICQKDLQDKCSEYFGISSFANSDLMIIKKINDIISFFIISPKSSLQVFN